MNIKYTVLKMYYSNNLFKVQHANSSNAHLPTPSCYPFVTLWSILLHMFSGSLRNLTSILKNQLKKLCRVKIYLATFISNKTKAKKGQPLMTSHKFGYFLTPFH